MIKFLTINAKLYSSFRKLFLNILEVTALIYKEKCMRLTTVQTYIYNSGEKYLKRHFIQINKVDAPLRYVTSWYKLGNKT